MQVNLKYMVFLILLVFFSGCASKNTVFSLNKKVLILGKSNENKISIKLTNPKVKRYISRCVFSSYTLFDKNLDYGNLFIEKIALKSSCSWMGSPVSFLESSIKEELKIKRLERVEEFDIQGYNFITYKVDDSYFNLIYIYARSQDKFIIDYYGRVYDKVLKSFKVDYENKYLTKKRFIGDYDDGLVRKSLYNNYFERERLEL